MPEDTTCLFAVLLETDETSLAEAEEERWEQEQSVRLTMEEARLAYQTGQFMTIDEYLKINGYIVC